jgi:hypothetical protein
MWWRRLRWLLALIAISSIATCPIGWRACRKQARHREADDLLRYLGERAAVVFATTHSLPRTPAGPTPALGSCCKHDGGRCPADPAQWDAPAWRALSFTIDDDHRFSYQYTPTPDGGAILRAAGDVDCDLIPAILELRLTPTPDGKALLQTWTRQPD